MHKLFDITCIKRKGASTSSCLSFPSKFADVRCSFILKIDSDMIFLTATIYRPSMMFASNIYIERMIDVPSLVTI